MIGWYYFNYTSWPNIFASVCEIVLRLKQPIFRNLIAQKYEVRR